MLHYLLLFPVLFLFWLLLSGHFTPLFYAYGVISVLLVIWLQHRMDRIDREPALLKVSVGLVRYGLWLGWNLLLSNIDVARRIWDPKLPIEPVWERLDIQLTSPREITLYASSITLTPGTLTTDIKEGYFLVHTLNPEGMAELRRGEMERRIKALGI